ncbi:MAG: hypothetical protein ACTSPL_03970 [Candidatus Odinarchaeia archaeon]
MDDAIRLLESRAKKIKAKLVSDFEFRPMDDKVYESLMKSKDPRLIALWWRGTGWNRTYVILEDLKNAVRHKQFTVIRIFGRQRSGKSEAAQKLAKKWKEYCKKFHGIDGNIYFSFSFSQTAVLNRKCKFGDVIIQDETPWESGKGSSLIEKDIVNILETMAVNGICYIFVGVSLKYIDKIQPHIILQTHKMNRKDRITKLIIWNPQYFITPNIAVINVIRQNTLPVLGWAYIRLHDDEELRQRYIKMKQEFVAKVGETGGSIASQVSPEYARQCVEKTIAFIKKNPDLIPDYSKVSLEMAVRMSGISGGAEFQMYIANLVKKKLKEEAKEKYVEDVEVEDVVIPRKGQNFLNYAVEKIRLIEGEVEADIMDRLFKGEKQVDLAKEYEKYGFNQSKISLLKAKIAESYFGDLFEEWYRVQKNDMRKSKGHGIEEPDVIADFPYESFDMASEEELYKLTDIYSLKTEMNYSPRSRTYYFEKSFNPEVSYCEKYGIKKFTIVFCNPLRCNSKIIEEYVVDLNNLPKRITFCKEEGREPIVRY